MQNCVSSCVLVVSSAAAAAVVETALEEKQAQDLSMGLASDRTCREPCMLYFSVQFVQVGIGGSPVLA